MPKISRLVDFGGQLFDPRHDPPLLWEWGKKNLKIEKSIFL
jgi:hypothetical protein